MSSALAQHLDAAAPRARRRRLRWLLLVALVAAYPVAVLSYVYWFSLTSGLPGGRHGPQDAYRHVLASAVVAYTLSPRVVHWVSAVMEPNQTDLGDRMDRHNNAIGAAIGEEAESFAAIRPEVERRVAAGRVFARHRQQVTWLPPSMWRELPI
jgi:flagellar basal body-associated protein FliL